MSITPADLLALADELHQQPRETHQRSAAGRAYYAAYHLCLLVRTKLPHASGNRPGMHAALVEDLAGFLGDPPEYQIRVRALGAMLNQCRVNRITADYELTDPFSPADAEVTIVQARRIAERVAQLLK